MEINNTYQMHTSLLHDNFKKNLTLKLVLFIIAPFFSFLYSLRRPNARSSFAIFFLFGVLYAWNMDCHVENDFTRLVDQFYTENYPIQDVFDEMLKFFSGESKQKEFYRIFLFSLVQSFSQNYHLVFFLASIPYMFFMLKSLSLITNDIHYRVNSLYCYVVIFLFIIPYTIFWISNFRFSTAVWVSVYSIISLLYTKKKKYILLLALTPFIHSGFWFLLIILVLYYLIPKNIRWIKILFYISIPFSFIESNLLSIIDVSNFSFLPDTIYAWINSYLTDAEMLLKFGMYRKDGSGMYFVELFFGKAIVISYIVGLIYIIRNVDMESQDPELKSFYYFLIFYFAITNFIQVVPALGPRNMSIVEILFIFLWYKALGNSKNKKYVYIMLCAWSYNIVFFESSYLLMMVDVDFFFSNVFSIISKNLGVVSQNLIIY